MAVDGLDEFPAAITRTAAAPYVFVCVHSTGLQVRHERRLAMHLRVGMDIYHPIPSKAWWCRPRL